MNRPTRNSCSLVDHRQYSMTYTGLLQIEQEWRSRRGRNLLEPGTKQPAPSALLSTGSNCPSSANLSRSPGASFALFQSPVEGVAVGDSYFRATPDALAECR